MQKNSTLGVIGGGFMAHAIVSGAISSGFLAPEHIIVAEPDAQRRAAFSRLGTLVTDDNRAAADGCRYLLLCVKPQTFPAVAEDLRNISLPVTISIMAGKTKQSIRRQTGAGAIARVMPNLPCSVGAGMAGIDSSELSDEERDFVYALFGAVGKTVEVEESLLNAVTGISGSGPAYVYLFYRALVQAGVAEGLSQEQAQALAAQTITGGMEMLRVTKKTPDELIAAVSSKGGTTVAALDRFAQDGFEQSVCRAVHAAVSRAEELSE